MSNSDARIDADGELMLRVGRVGGNVERMPKDGLLAQHTDSGTEAGYGLKQTSSRINPSTYKNATLPASFQQTPLKFQCQ